MYGRTSNGHAADSERYGTRCATGVIPRKRYDKVFTDDDDEDDDDANDCDNEASGMRGDRTLKVRSTRSGGRGTHAVSDSSSENSGQDDSLRETRTPSKSAASSSFVTSSSSTVRYSHHSNDAESSSDSETTSSAAGSQSSSDDSGSDTEAYSEGGEVGAAKSARMTRSRGKPVVTNGHHVRNGFGGRDDNDAKYRTRNQGRRTVHYEEADSDVDCDTSTRDGRRSLERRRTEVGSRARLCRS